MININSFASRHIGPRNEDIAAMLKIVNCKSLDELIKKTVPEHILFTDKLKLKPGMSEDFNKVNMQLLSLKNKLFYVELRRDHEKERKRSCKRIPKTGS